MSCNEILAMSSWKAIPVLLTLSFAHFVSCVLAGDDVWERSGKVEFLVE